MQASYNRLLQMLTVTGEDLQDVGLVNETVQVVQHPLQVPHPITLLQQLQLMRALLCKLASVLGKGLELVNELVHHVPQPVCNTRRECQLQDPDQASNI